MPTSPKEPRTEPIATGNTQLGPSIGSVSILALYVAGTAFGIFLTEKKAQKLRKQQRSLQKRETRTVTKTTSKTSR